jgi:hypothetical protein
MSEGELKKPFDNFPYIPSMVPVQLSLLQEQVIEQNKWIRNYKTILDEANANFPETAILELLAPVLSKELLEKVKEQVYRFYAYRKKWFGE